jgi:hypothetical protein
MRRPGRHRRVLAAVRVADFRVMIVCPPILTTLLRGHRDTTASRDPHLKPVRSERRPAYDHVRERGSSHSGDLSGLPSPHDRGHGRRHGLARPVRRRAESVECFSFDITDRRSGHPLSPGTTSSSRCTTRRDCGCGRLAAAARHRSLSVPVLGVKPSGGWVGRSHAGRGVGAVGGVGVRADAQPNLGPRSGVALTSTQTPRQARKRATT